MTKLELEKLEKVIIELKKLAEPFPILQINVLSIGKCVAYINVNKK